MRRRKYEEKEEKRKQENKRRKEEGGMGRVGLHEKRSVKARNKNVEKQK